MKFGSVYASFTKEIREIIESIIQDAKEDHIVHLQKGAEQIQQYMQTYHENCNTFDEVIQKYSMNWQKHVTEAKESAIAKTTERPVLSSVCTDLTGIDIRVAAKGCPDDAIYNSSEYARRMLPRGNFVAQWSNSRNGETYYFPLVRAYPKFTGHEDDGEVSKTATTGDDLLKYFTKPRSSTQSVISTIKENGEAAHLAVLKQSDNSYLYIVGSKNVHLIVSSLEDIDPSIQYGLTETDLKHSITSSSSSSTPNYGPYAGARPVAIAILEMLFALPETKRELFTEFLWQTRLTASFELLCPSHQHVEYLNVVKDTPVLFGFSFPTLRTLPGIEICMNPILGYTFARYCEVRTVDYQIGSYATELDDVLLEIKNGYGYEGKVNLYVDSSASIIGLEKFKTAWYVCLRAFREKAKRYLNLIFGKKKIPLQDAKFKTIEDIQNRMKAITSFLHISSTMAQEYFQLGEAFVRYLGQRIQTETEANYLINQVTDFFPIIWREFLKEMQLQDRIVDV